MKPILFLNPVFKQTIWGGDRLRTQFGYDIPCDSIGECWGVSAHPGGDCIVREGIYAGWPLSRLWEEKPELFGNSEFDYFPLLTKIIDSTGDCSIQVHPDDAYAKKNENGSLGKMECWYVLECPENASFVIGHNAATREELADMIQQGRWEDLIRKVPVKKGDFIQINPGTVHNITSGLMILETQQNSDITYRLYDYGRLKDGKPRTTHTKQSVDVITVPAAAAEDCIKNVLHQPENQMNELISCEYYKVWKLQVTKPISFAQEYPFLIMSVIEGEGSVNDHQIQKGDHFIVPNKFGMIEMKGDMTLIISTAQ